MDLCARCGVKIGLLMRIFGGKRVYNNLCVNCNAIVYQEQLAEEERRRQAYLSSIRQGYLPRVQLHSSMYLDSDAICYLYVPAIYFKEDDTNHLISSTEKPGSLIATNKHLCFLSSGRSSTIQWSNIVLIKKDDNGIRLRTSKGTGAGFYKIHDVDVTHAILETCVKIAKRQLLPPGNAFQVERSRSIPQHVKKSVWQIYGGKCAECGADREARGVELQYDHIIPFSRGGANTVENVQLLCSICNKKKGNRI